MSVALFAIALLLGKGLWAGIVALHTWLAPPFAAAQTRWGRVDEVESAPAQFTRLPLLFRFLGAAALLGTALQTGPILLRRRPSRCAYSRAPADQRSPFSLSSVRVSKSCAS